MPLIIAGCDLSKNSPGIVKLILDDKTLDIIDVQSLGFTSVKKNEQAGIIFYKKTEFNCSFAQTLFLEKQISKFISDCSHIAIEDYAFSAAGDITGLAEFAGYIKLQSYTNNIRIRLYDIPSIKMYATDLGTADKLSMYQSFVKYNEYKPNILTMPIVNKGPGISPTSDIIDAYFISELLRTELKLRKGLIRLKDLDEKKIRIFNRVTKSFPTNILDRDFIQKI